MNTVNLIEGEVRIYFNDLRFCEYCIKSVMRWRSKKSYRSYLERFGKELSLDERIKYLTVIRENYTDYLYLYDEKVKQSGVNGGDIDELMNYVDNPHEQDEEGNYIFRENDEISKILKYLLWINYSYDVVDALKESAYYRKEIKFHINRLEKEFDKEMKTEMSKQFYGGADWTSMIENMDIMEEFFSEMSRLHSSDLQSTMLSFIDEMKRVKTIRKNEYGKES